MGKTRKKHQSGVCFTLRIQRGVQGVQTPPGKSKNAIRFLGNIGMDHPPEAIGSFGSNCFEDVLLLLEGGPYGPL